MNILMVSERIAFDHRGVTIWIDLNYENGTVSFTDKQGSAKPFKFAQRTREYLGGWWLILDALQEATKYADTRLKEQAEARDQIKEKKVIDMMIALSDLDKKGKK